MPVGRSPISGENRFKALNNAASNSALSEDSSAGSPGQNIASNITNKEEFSTLSWSNQCSTPTGELASSNSVTIVTSTSTYASATVNSFAARTSTTISTQPPKLTAIASPNMISTSPTAASSNLLSSDISLTNHALQLPLNSSKSNYSSNTLNKENIAMLSNSRPLSSISQPQPLSTQTHLHLSHNKENSKRSRISPNKSKSSNKKVKTNAVTLDSWLSKCPTPEANRYSELMENVCDDSEEIVEISNNNKHNNNSANEHKSAKPPPISVQNVQTIGNLISALNNISNFKYNLKVLKDNRGKN